VSTYVSVDLQRQVRSHFVNCCAYCRTAESLTVTTFEFEHIVPLAKGGETTFKNLCLACPSCNRYKAVRQTATDPITQTEVLLFHPQRQAWANHFAWNEGAIEIIGLTPTGRATIAALKMNRPQVLRVRKMWVKMGEHPPKGF
jgi:HNH endonuclease